MCLLINDLWRNLFVLIGQSRQRQISVSLLLHYDAEANPTTAVGTDIRIKMNVNESGGTPAITCQSPDGIYRSNVSRPVVKGWKARG